MPFDRASATLLRNELEDVLAKHLAGRKLSVKIDNFRYGPNMVSIKVDAFEKIEGQEKAQCPYWNTHGPAYGLKPEWLGMPVHLNNVKYILVGFDPGRPKKNIQLRRANQPHGQIYICKSTQIVARANELDEAVRNKSVEDVIEKLPEALKAIEKPVAGTTNVFAKAARPFGGEW